MPRTVLFLCTGNYYRSRFAAVLFTALAAQEGLDWAASSRGLKIGWPGNLGAMSEHTERRLAELNVPLDGFRHMPMRCRACDLEGADHVVALKEAEHRAMLAERFGDWQDRVTYWHVHDVDQAHPEQALAEIEELVAQLVVKLKEDSK
jgi:protein-tyrosine phosphatase